MFDNIKKLLDEAEVLAKVIPDFGVRSKLLKCINDAIGIISPNENKPIKVVIEEKKPCSNCKRGNGKNKRG